MFYCMLMFASVAPTLIFAQSASGKQVAVSYKLNRIPGPGSNQLAMWIEDASGNYVRSIYASKFTASGGYAKRPSSLSVWVEKAGWANASQAEIDAVSGSTQMAGENTLVWDCTDKNGKPVANGTYFVKMEANIKNERKMFFSAPVNVGGPAMRVEGVVSYLPEDAAAGDKIFENVVVEYR